MTELLECIEVEPNQTATASVIWLHGLGADGNDFVPVVPALALPEDLAIRFIFPHAPVRPVAVNNGMPMRAWFNVFAMGATREIKESDLDDSCAAVAKLIEREERRGISSDRIFVFGFSQGGAVGYQTALRYSRPLAGFAALSCYRINPGNSSNQAQGPNTKLPMLVAHGEQDRVVPMGLGREAYQSVVDEGLTPLWKTYPMDHEVCMPQLQDLAAWMQERLA